MTTDDEARQVFQEIHHAASTLFRALDTDGDGHLREPDFGDHVLALNHRVTETLELKADAIDQLAYDLVTATGRNYLHTCAQELREQPADGDQGAAAPERNT